MGEIRRSYYYWWAGTAVLCAGCYRSYLWGKTWTETLYSIWTSFGFSSGGSGSGGSIEEGKSCGKVSIHPFQSQLSPLLAQLDRERERERRVELPVIQLSWNMLIVTLRTPQRIGRSESLSDSVYNKTLLPPSSSYSSSSSSSSSLLVWNQLTTVRLSFKQFLP